MAIGDYYIQDGALARADQEITITCYSGVNLTGVGWTILKNAPSFTLDYFLSESFKVFYWPDKQWLDKEFIIDALNWLIKRESI